MTEELTSNSGGPEEQSTYSLESVIEDFKKVITDPAGFYRAMPTDGGYLNPLIFIAVMAVAAGLLMTILSVVGLGVGSTMTFGSALMMVVMLPIGAGIGSFIAGGVLFIVWKLMGSSRNYETAYRCIAFATAIMPFAMLLSIIPYLGTIAKNLWGAYLLYIASIEVHSIKQQTAKIVFAVLAALVVLSGIRTEYKLRNLQSYIDKAYNDATANPRFKDLENMENMSPEEAGRKMGEFLKGMEETIKAADKQQED